MKRVQVASGHERELGIIEQRLIALEKRTNQQCQKLDELLKLKQQIEGGKKAVTFLVAVAASVGATVGYIAQHVSWKF